MLSAQACSFADAHTDEAVSLLKTLAQTPAPSGQEHRRAVFCLDWLHTHGVAQAYMDDVCNVVIPFGATDNTPLVVFCAHSDVVFPDSDALPLHEENGRLYCPGIGDDTANVVALLMAARFLAENDLTLHRTGLLLVIDSCEEGLGNLKGIRHVMDVFGGRVTEFISFDCHADELITDAVGSRRYSIAVDTVGGHSYFDFGATNAIAVLSAVIDELYTIAPPDGTTYNVGDIRGGTSVNTIAQHAEMLFEIRSDNAAALEQLQAQLDAVLAQYRREEISITVTPLGNRPCAKDVDAVRQTALVERAASRICRHFGSDPVRKAGSTDCNIPLSMGIPSVCFGCILGAGMHTREEYIELDSICPGLRLALDMVLSSIQ